MKTIDSPKLTLRKTLAILLTACMMLSALMIAWPTTVTLADDSSPQPKFIPDITAGTYAELMAAITGAPNDQQYAY